MGFEGADGNEETDPITPHLNPIDGINPMDNTLKKLEKVELHQYVQPLEVQT